jgi:outer membrane protein assembly factor BamB
MTRTLAATVLTAVTALAGTTSSPPSVACTAPGWPQPRQSSCGTGSSTETASPSAAQAPQLALVWTATLAGPVGNPIADGSRVYVMTGRLHPRLHGLDLASGRSLWGAIGGQRDTGFPYADPGPILDGGVLVRESGLGTLRRYDPATGRIFWRRTIPSMPESPIQQAAVSDGVWVESQGEQLVAYDAAHGTPLWHQALACFDCRVSAAGGRVYAAGGGRLVARGLQTGAAVWSVGAGDTSAASSPLLADGVLVVAVRRGTPTIEAFRPSDGTALWQTRLPAAKGFYPTAAEAAGNGLVVYHSVDGNLYALDLRTGAVRWKHSVGDVNGAPAIGNGVVWTVDSTERLLALASDDGSVLWSSPSISALDGSSPVLAGGYVLIGTPDGRLLAYAATG